MLYVRGQPLDYDTWAQQGNRRLVLDGESVLPYFRKSSSTTSVDSDEFAVERVAC